MSNPKYIYRAHADFVRGDDTVYWDRKTIEFNLAKKLNLTPHEITGCSYHWNMFVGLIAVISIGLPFTGVGGLILWMMVKTIIEGNTKNATDIILVGIVCSIGLLGLGLGTIIKFIKRFIAGKIVEPYNELDLQLIKGYVNLTEKGVLIEGEFLKISRLPSRWFELEYLFQAPNGKYLTGKYLVPYRKRFIAGDKLMVLYSDEQLHIVL